jgi:hypothetical protein
MDNSFGIVVMAWTIEKSWFDSLREQETYLHRNAETGSGAPPVSYSMSTTGSLPEVKRSERDYSLPSKIEGKNEWRFTPFPHTPLRLEQVQNYF